MSTSASASPTRVFSSAFEHPAYRSPNATLSKTDMNGNSA